MHLSYDKRSNRIAYAANKSIHVRSVEKPEESIQYTLHTAATTVAKFSPSGFYVASGDATGTVRVWDVVGEDLITKGEYHVISGRINDIAWDADSQRIIAVGDGKEKYGHCFTADSGNTVGEITGHSNVINAVDIRPVRPYRAATVSDDSSLIFLHGPPFKFNASVKDKHTSFVHDVKFSPNGEHIVSVSADHKIALYDGKTGEFKNFVGEKDGHSGSIFGVSWAADSSKFVTASADATVRLWDVSGDLVKTWTFEKSVSNQQVGVVYAGDYIISLSFSGELNYLTPESDSPVKVLSGHQKSITALAVPPEAADSIYSGSYDGKVVQWELKTGTSKTVTGDGHETLVASLLPSSDGSSVWSIAWDDTLKTLSGTTFKGTAASLGAQPTSASNDGDVLAIVTENTLQIYDNGSGKEVATKTLSFPAKAVAVSVAAGLVAVGRANDYGVSLFNLKDLTDADKSSSKLAPLRAAPSYAAFSPDGKYLAAGDSTGKIIVYNVADRSVKTSRWAMHTSRVTSIAWHPSGDYVATGASDADVYIYSVKVPGKAIKNLRAHKDGVNAVVWTSSASLATAGADATIKLWDVKFP